MSTGQTTRASLTFGPRAFLKSLGFALDKKPHQIDRLFLRSLSKEDAEALQMLWLSRNVGLSDGLGMYLLPKSLKSAALLFSYDWPRAAATMEWFDEAIRLVAPTSVVEMGSGAGFLLAYLQERYPAVGFQGVDAASNLVEVGSQLLGKALIAGDYLTVPADVAYDLVICDFGFDIASFRPSTIPHTIESVAGVSYCPGCSNDLKSQFDAYLQAWRRWVRPSGHLAIAGRLANFGMVRAFVLSASDAGWKLNLDGSKILVVGMNSDVEKFPAMVFDAAEKGSAGPDIEMVARFFCG